MKEWEILYLDMLGPGYVVPLQNDLWTVWEPNQDYELGRIPFINIKDIKIGEEYIAAKNYTDVWQVGDIVTITQIAPEYITFDKEGNDVKLALNEVPSTLMKLMKEADTNKQESTIFAQDNDDSFTSEEKLMDATIAADTVRGIIMTVELTTYKRQLHEYGIVAMLIAVENKLSEIKAIMQQPHMNEDVGRLSLDIVTYAIQAVIETGKQQYEAYSIREED